MDEAQPQFKVEIKNDVIHEEEEEADAALSKVANTLRAVCTLSATRLSAPSDLPQSKTPFHARQEDAEMFGIQCSSRTHPS